MYIFNSSVTAGLRSLFSLVSDKKEREHKRQAIEPAIPQYMTCTYFGLVRMYCDVVEEY